jgi:hypothetical protein
MAHEMMQYLIWFNYSTMQSKLLALIQSAAEWAPTCFKVTGKGVVGVGRRGRWQQFGRIVSLSVNTMNWSGERRGFVIEAFCKNNDFVIATQRAFRTRFWLYATDVICPVL